MTTTTPWAHLPNARHIDAVLAEMKERPKFLYTARKALSGLILGGEWLTARVYARQVIHMCARDVIWRAVWSNHLAPLIDIPDIAIEAVRNTTTALIAWDSAADLLDLPPDVLRTMVDLAPEPVNHQAALLLPWVTIKTTEEVT